MAQTDPSLQKKTLMALPHDRCVGSIVPKPFINTVSSDLILSPLRPYFVEKSKKTATILSGFTLLRKEPYDPKNAIGSIKKHDKNSSTQALAISIHGAPPRLHYENEPDHVSFIFCALSSLILHGLVILPFILTLINFRPQATNGNSNQGQQPVDVVFMPSPTGSSGLTGAGIDGEEGQATPPPPATLPEFSPPPTPEKDVAAPKPEAEQIPDMENAIIHLPKEQKQPQTPPQKQQLKNHQYTNRYVPKRQQRRREIPPQQSNNPFETINPLDFSENPNKSRRKAAARRAPQGSHSGIDMSTGPLVKNGKINVPYATKVNIRGVSDGYGAAINAWIRQHLYYPIDAARNGEDGGASVHVSLNRDGYVLSVSLTNSSGSESLDAAITGMFRGARLPKIPPDLPDHFELDLTVNYILLHQ